MSPVPGRRDVPAAWEGEDPFRVRRGLVAEEAAVRSGKGSMGERGDCARGSQGEEGLFQVQAGSLIGDRRRRGEKREDCHRLTAVDDGASESNGDRGLKEREEGLRQAETVGSLQAETGMSGSVGRRRIPRENQRNPAGEGDVADVAAEERTAGRDDTSMAGIAENVKREKP
ncbi:hypothetical protein CBR_g28599 [Chara braunii]|uniref:Uncharacterized protein n=1 Tax=Chara braunii TaxID=69332 RepID=A0A388L9C3_CHABU|nr:hypothetical protein CBR_g28599 [Chara braunii]|eukprot:GBG78884.1 hypothetical protein CBR_g28599 [Chara braunii]